MEQGSTPGTSGDDEVQASSIEAMDVDKENNSGDAVLCEVAKTARQNWASLTIKRKQTQRTDPPEQLWEIPPGNERLVLDRCS